MPPRIQSSSGKLNLLASPYDISTPSGCDCSMLYVGSLGECLPESGARASLALEFLSLIEHTPISRSKPGEQKVVHMSAFVTLLCISFSFTTTSEKGERFFSSLLLNHNPLLKSFQYFSMLENKSQNPAEGLLDAAWANSWSLWSYIFSPFMCATSHIPLKLPGTLP